MADNLNKYKITFDNKINKKDLNINPLNEKKIVTAEDINNLKSCINDLISDLNFEKNVISESLNNIKDTSMLIRNYEGFSDSIFEKVESLSGYYEILKENKHNFEKILSTLYHFDNSTNFENSIKNLHIKVAEMGRNLQSLLSQYNILNNNYKKLINDVEEKFQKNEKLIDKIQVIINKNENNFPYTNALKIIDEKYETKKLEKLSLINYISTNNFKDLFLNNETFLNENNKFDIDLFLDYLKIIDSDLINISEMDFENFTSENITTIHEIINKLNQKIDKI